MTIVACGTSYLAGLVAKYWLEKMARLPVEIDIASEFRYRAAPMPQGGLALFISQSGETADTLAALRYARGQGQHIVSLINVEESTMARESDLVLKVRAGPEIGVASTKAFTTQLVALACFALVAARARGAIDADDVAQLSAALAEVARIMREGFDREVENALDGREVRWSADRDHAWDYLMDGSWSLCLKELSASHVAEKEVALASIARIANADPDHEINDGERTELEAAVAQYDRVALPFAPHEVDESSRRLKVGAAIEKYRLAMDI